MDDSDNLLHLLAPSIQQHRDRLNHLHQTTTAYTQHLLHDANHVYSNYSNKRMHEALTTQQQRMDDVSRVMRHVQEQSILLADAFNQVASVYHQIKLEHLSVVPGPSAAVLSP